MDLGFPPPVPGAGPDAADDAATQAADIVRALAELAERHAVADGAGRGVLAAVGGAFNAAMAARLTAWKKG